MLASINHENVVQYKEAFFDDDSSCLCLIIEYCEEGVLFLQTIIFITIKFLKFLIYLTYGIL